LIKQNKAGKAQHDGIAKQENSTNRQASFLDAFDDKN